MNSKITRFALILVLLLMSLPSSAQQARISITVSRSGKDLVGSSFEAALRQELLQSTKYVSKNSEGAKTKPELLIKLNTVDVAESKSQEGKRSAVSVVIEQFGLPNSYPVATMWYHKMIIVDKELIETLARDLLYDMDARYCNYMKSSIGGCPKEKFEPKLFQ